MKGMDVYEWDASATGIKRTFYSADTRQVYDIPISEQNPLTLKILNFLQDVRAIKIISLDFSIIF